MELRDKNGLTEKEFLAAYSPKDYPKPSVTADIAIIRRAKDKDELLLVRRGGHPCISCWALPGGFANKNEPLEETAARELEEETGLSGIALEPVGLFSAPGRDPRGWVISQAYCAVVCDDLKNMRAGDDAADAAWFAIDIKKGTESIGVKLTSDKDSFEIILKKRSVAGICGEKTVFEAADGSRLAFDHAQIIACALKTAGMV